MAIAAAIASPGWNMGLDDPQLVVWLVLIGLGTALAVAGAWLRSVWVGRSERLRLLDSVGAVADGSLPLAETLRRVTEVIVPALADVCMVDAIHEGRVSRIATSVRERPDRRVDRGADARTADRSAAMARRVRAQLAAHPAVVAADPRRGAAADVDLPGGPAVSALPRPALLDRRARFARATATSVR